MKQWQKILLTLLFSDIDYTMQAYNPMDEDWDAILRYCDKSKLLTVVVEKVRDKVPKEICQYYDRKSSIEKRVRRNLVLEMQELNRVFETNGIEVIITKGAALSKLLYDDAYMRYYGDVDIVIKQFDTCLNKCLEVMKMRGYKHAYGWNLKREINLENPLFAETTEHHEISCTKGLGGFEKSVEIKKSLSCIPVKGVGLFNKKVQNIQVDSENICTYNIPATFVILCSNTFVNSETRSAILYGGSFLRDYYETLLFIIRFINYLPCESIVNLVKQAGSTLRVKRVMQNMLELIDDTVIQSLVAQEIKSWIHAIMDRLQDSDDGDGLFKDIFMEHEVIPYEIIDWSIPFVKRLFSIGDYKTIGMESYKKSIYNAKLKMAHNPVSRKLFSPRGDIKYSIQRNKNKWICSICFSNMVEGALGIKLEFLTPQSYRNGFFLGMMFYKDSPIKPTSVFHSNAKHHEDITEEKVNVTFLNNTYELNIDIILERIIREEGRAIGRISTILRIDEELHQELQSESFVIESKVSLP